MKTSGLFILSIFILSSQAWASDFANCRNANKQLKFTNESSTNDLKAQAAKILIQELQQIRPQLVKNKTDIPTRLLQVCYQNKHLAFQNLYINGNEALFEMYDFLMASGEFLFINQEWERSFASYEKAAKLRPNFFEPNFYALQGWAVIQATSEKPLSGDIFLRKARFYVDAMNKAQDVEPAHKAMGIQLLADLEDYSQKAYSARNNFKIASTLDPQNLKIRLNWGLFEERSGRFEDAQKIYEAALAVTSLDMPLQKQIALKLLKLYEVQGKRKEHQKRLAWAQSYFKGDSDVKNIQPMRLPASVK